MTPKVSHLGVRPGVPVIVGLGAVALFFIASSVRAPEATEPALPRRRPAPVRDVAPRPLVFVDEVRAPLPAETASTPIPTASSMSPVAAGVLTVPPAADEDAALLQEWILSLPDADLRAFQASGALGCRVAQIGAELSQRNPDPQASLDDIDRFLARLNARLGVVPP